MRWLFLFVLSLNLTYIAWQMNKSPADGYTSVAPLKNVQPIILLSELKQQQAAAVKKEEKVESLEPETAATSAENLSTKENQSDRQAGSDESAAANKAAAKKVPLAVAELTPAVATAPSAPVKQAGRVAANTQQADAIKAVVAKTSQSASCFTLGPFRDLGKLRGLIREIKSYVIEADFRGRKEKEQTLYWVYINPEKNRRQAIATGKRLKAKKIKDFYVIREGEKENGLSLGHFRNKKGAYSLAKKVENLGFDVFVEPVFKIYTIYWLDYQLDTGAVIPESIFDKYIKSAKKEKISRLPRDCDG